MKVVTTILVLRKSLAVICSDYPGIVNPILKELLQIFLSHFNGLMHLTSFPANSDLNLYYFMNQRN